MKKRISLAIAVIMIMTHLLSIVSFADFKDVTEDNSYRQAIITLTKLGVINGYEESDNTFTFRPEGKITRAEFTKMLVTALGRGNHTTEPTEFSDVAGHWARFNIKTAYDMGIINGFDDGTFRPDEQVTYEQALKMMVCTLGYIDFAEGKGGWPDGYTSQANELGLTKGVTNQKNSEAALRQVIAQVVYNALEVHKMEKGVTGDYEQTTKTILNNDLKVYKVKGTLVGVEEIQTDECNSNLLDYQMAVEEDGTEHIIDVRNYTDLSIVALQQYVGKQVTVYYSQPRSNDDKSLVVFDADSVKNTTYEISYEDIVSYDGSTLKYYPENAVRTSTINTNLANMTIVYNGETLNTTDTYPVKGIEATSVTNITGKVAVATEILDPSSQHFIYGDVTFTDSGSDGTIDMATINDYRWMVAYKTVNSTDYKVQNSLVTTDSLILDPDGINQKVYVEKNGKEVEPTAISSGDILTYTKSFDETIKRVYVSKQTVTGEVNSLSADKITIAGKEYNLDKNCVQYMKNKGNSVSVGSNVTMYLDKMGTVVYGTVKQDAAIPYAYIADVVYDGGEDATYVKAFYPTLSSTKLSNMQLSASAKIDGKKINNANEALSLLSASASNTENNGDAEAGTGYDGTAPTNTTYSQVAKIKYDKSAKEITEIITLSTDASTVGKTNTDKSIIVKSRDFAKYKNNSTTFTEVGGSANFKVNSSTVIIDVPADRTSETNYMKKTSSNFTSKSEECWAEAYDVDSSRVASLVIRYNISTTTRITKKSKTSQHSVVAGNISRGVDENEELVSKLPVYSASESQKSLVISNSDTSFNSLAVGDVIQYDTDEEGKIQGMEYVIKYSDIKNVLDGGLYDWTQTLTPDSTNRYQRYKFEFEFPKLNSSGSYQGTFEPYTSNGADYPYSRAVMYNVVRILDDNTIQVTKEGFAADGSMDIDVVEVEEVKISSSTNMIKLASNGQFVTVNDEGNDLSIADLKDVEHYGMNCSKIMVSTITGSVKLVVIYQ